MSNRSEEFGKLTRQVNDLEIKLTGLEYVMQHYPHLEFDYYRCPECKTAILIPHGQTKECPFCHLTLMRYGNQLTTYKHSPGGVTVRFYSAFEYGVKI